MNSDNADRQHHSNIDNRRQVCRQEAQTGKPQVNAPHRHSAQRFVSVLLVWKAPEVARLPVMSGRRGSMTQPPPPPPPPGERADSLDPDGVARGRADGRTSRLTDPAADHSRAESAEPR